MSTSFQLYPVMRRSLVLAVFAGAGLAVAGAQTTSSAAAGTSAAQPVSFQAAAVPSFASTSAPAFSSSLSSSADGYDPAQTANQQLASVEKTFAMPGAEGMQYGQRRRYGAPRYRGGNTNADGSEKYTGYVGGGFAAPASSNFNYATTSWGFEVGAGRNFNKHFGTNIEFDYDHFGMTSATLQNQETLYNDITQSYDPAAPGDGNVVAGLDGNSHIWSFSLDPVYNVRSGEGLGAYITGGAGFYHKVANFTVPAEGEYCDYIYGCYTYVANQVIDHYTSNAFGVNAGFGVTYKFSRFANERLFGEVKYVYTFNANRPGVTLATLNNTNVGLANDFPQNSLHTGYLPVKFGIRF